MEYSGVNDEWATEQDIRELRLALEAVLTMDRKGADLRGLFGRGDRTTSLALVFGMTPSPLWFFPGLQGGTGNPISPPEAVLNKDVCAAWARLAAAVDKYSSRRDAWEERATAK